MMESTTRFLPEWLGRRARLTPDRVAVVGGDRSRTYRELDREVSDLAATLTSLGARANDRIALLMNNGYTVVLATHALVRIGAILIPLNSRLTVADLAWQISDSGASRLLHDLDHSSAAREVGEHVSGLAVTLVTAGSSDDDRSRVNDRPVQWFGEAKLDLNAVQSIVYTSGTTGLPKGAMITYGNLWWSAIGSALNLGNQENDRWLACLPLYHVGGMSILFRAVVNGIAVIIHEAFDAVAVNWAIDEENVTIVSVVSTMLQRMLDARGSRTYPPSLRCVLLGGGPASEQLLSDCVARSLPVVQTYGLTEAASQVATLDPADALRKLGSAGKPLFPTELRIELDGAPARSGEVGEIVVAGPTITPGYFNRPEATARALRGRWLHTGDLGYLDEEGFLYVVDRREDLVVTGGENVYPAEVERVLREHPSVAEAVVVGLPDPQWGQTVAAVIQPRIGANPTGAEIIAFSRARLAGYKVPRLVRFVDELPRNAAGKILRRALRDSWPTDPTPQ